MGSLEVILIALFVSVAGLNALATWLDIPYPILLVLGGIALGAVPGIPGSSRPHLARVDLVTNQQAGRPGRREGRIR